jgi:hypothetical protein
MRVSGARTAHAILADRRIPEGRLDDPDELAAVSTAITLRAARPGAGQVDSAFVLRLRRLLAAELAGAPPTAGTARRRVPRPRLPPRRRDGRIQLLLPQPPGPGTGARNPTVTPPDADG